MTPDDLRAIALRHAENEAWTPGQIAVVTHEGKYKAQAHVDRAALLSLVRQVAETDPMHQVLDPRDQWDTSTRTECRFCEGDRNPVWDGYVLTGDVYHRPDCLWLVAQGAKP